MKVAALLERIRWRRWFCNQRDTVDCGAACLTMIARSTGRQYNLTQVRALCDVDRQGTSLLQLSRVAEKLGFQALCVRTSYDALARSAPFPLIVHWDQHHFVVVYGRTRRGLLVADPGQGLVSYSAAEFSSHWQSHTTEGDAVGYALVMEQRQEAADLHEPASDIEPAGLRLLLPYIRPHARTLAKVLGVVLLVSLLRMALPFLTRGVVDSGIARRDIGIIELILVAQIALLISRAGGEFIQARLLLHVGTRVDLALVSEFLRRLLRLPLAFFDSRMPGDLLQRIEDHARIEQLLSVSALLVITAALNVLIFGVTLAFFSTEAFRILLVGSILQSLYIAAFIRPRTNMEARHFGQMARTRGLMIECVNGISDIKIACAEAAKRTEWEGEQVKLHRIKIASFGMEQSQQVGSSLIAEIAGAIITVVAARGVIQGALTLGDLLAIQYLVGQVAGPIAQVVSVVQPVQGAKLSLQRMGEVFAAREEAGPAAATQPSQSGATLAVRNLCFGYKATPEAAVLRDVNMSIPAGKVTAIVGTSGSGKTTLVKLLLRLHDPTAGAIELGPLDLRTIDRDEWRARCGAVMQDGLLFTDTIARNIAFGKASIDAARVARVARLACIDQMIEQLPLRYETRVGPGGINVSQGQRQRLLIARALYGDPEFLVLDEATSALDAETEQDIVGNLYGVFRSRTVVVIAHRLSTVRHADQIVVLEQGRVVEVGDHAELVARGGRYLELVQNQLELQRAGV